MDYKNIKEIDNGVIIEGVTNFELAHIFECGQCFRWNKQKNGNYIGVALGRVIEVEKSGDNVIIYNTNIEEFKEKWEDYFDLKRDYSSIKEVLSEDELLKTAVEFGHGIRLLQQQPFELVISFIISANNRIPMIKKAINNISKSFGQELEYKGEIYHAFPTPEELQNASMEEIEACGTGFRAKYIVDTVDKIFNSIKVDYVEQYDLDYIEAQDDDKCHEALQVFNGIGPKVADCIMLFSMNKYSAFPVDVWVKRAMQHFYLAPDVSLKKIRDFGRNKFGELSGFAQQYLFYYARENNVNVE
jgi:N-glycosylase/DNA lyase